MTRHDVLSRLAAQRSALDRFHVRSIAVFGSVARGDAGPASDIDVLVEFSEPVGLFDFVRLRRFLEDALGAPVDLATPGSLKPALKQRILSEAVRVA